MFILIDPDSDEKKFYVSEDETDVEVEFNFRKYELHHQKVGVWKIVGLKKIYPRKMDEIRPNDILPF